jgi:protein-tyrosine phosphatase
MATWITPQIAVGDVVDSDFVEEFSAILNCAAEVEVTHELPVCHLNWRDNTSIQEFDMDLALNFLDHWVTFRKRNVLVHCIAGVSRSPAIVAAWLALRYNVNCFVEKMIFQDALDFVRSKRDCVFVHPRVLSSVEGYVRKRQLGL